MAGEVPYDQTVWPVIVRLYGPICARALSLLIRFRLAVRGHHDWPYKGVYPANHDARARVNPLKS